MWAVANKGVESKFWHIFVKSEVLKGSHNFCYKKRQNEIGCKKVVKNIRQKNAKTNLELF